MHEGAAQRPKVSSVAVELTAYCNQKCSYCYNEWREDGGKSLFDGSQPGPRQLERVRRLLDAWDIDHLTLTGGEPCASRELFPLLDLLRERGVGAQMISNGGLIDDALAKRLASYDLRFVQVTLNGPSRELHEAHVGEGHFELTLRGVRELVSARVPVVGCIVVTRQNANHVGEILELWEELGVRHIALSRFSPAGYAASHAATLLPSRSDLIAAFEASQAFMESTPKRFPAATLTKPRKATHQISCTMPVPPCAVEVERFGDIRFGTCPIGTGAQEFALGPDGKLRNCTLHRTAIGGVSDVLNPEIELAGLLQAQEVTEYRREQPEFCEGCLHVQTCAGGCGAAAEWVLGHARRYPDPFVWQHIDDTFGAELSAQRTSAEKRRLELIL
ncbi:MAG: radical SAM protein [Polyangiaceae bacterium]|nr:radical SAM protein [Polyangiaceae bacterium]